MNFQELKKELPRIKENIPLAQHTTFRIGGPARHFFTAKTREEIIKAVVSAKEHNLRFFVLGGGSNVLVSDKGYNGLLIKCQMSKSKMQNTKIYAEAGMSLANLVGLSAGYGLTGLEWAAGIPGTIGGAIRGNAAAFGGSIQDNIKRVEFFDIKLAKSDFVNFEGCKFGYRNSIFKQNRDLIILAVEIELEKGESDEIKKKIRDNLEYRRKHHPLNFPSAGSVFKNYKSQITNRELLKKYPELKEFNERENIPAGFLIDKSGLKGKTIGRAQISETHANFIINLGGAKAEDVLGLIGLAKKKVQEKFGLQLEEEICFLGFN